MNIMNCSVKIPVNSNGESSADRARHYSGYDRRKEKAILDRIMDRRWIYGLQRAV